MKKHISIAALASAVAMSTSAYADTAGTENSTLTYTWTGEVSNEWNYEDANWRLGDSTTTYPKEWNESTSVDAKFDTATSVTVTEAINASSVFISANTTFDIAETNSLSVGNELNLGGYTLTKSGAGSLNLTGATITSGILEATKDAVNVRNSSDCDFSMESGSMIKLNGGTLQAQSGENGGSNVVSIGDVGVVLSGNVFPVFIPDGGLFNAAGAKLYLDISELSGNVISIAIIRQPAFENGGFFSQILVGEWNDDGAWESNRGWNAVFVEDTGILTITAIPEPSAFGLLAGLGALALVGARRRRK